MRKRIIHKTTLSVTVLSDEPLREEMSLEDIAREMAEGDYVGRWSIRNRVALKGEEELEKALKDLREAK